MYPVIPREPESDGAQGSSYGAVILPASDLPDDELRRLLRVVHFTGWIAPADAGRRIVIGEPGEGVVADGRRGVIEVAALVAERIVGPVLAVRVRSDRQLALVAWNRGAEVARYCSDPSREQGAAKEVLEEPVGAEHAESFVELWGATDVDGDELVEQLTELLEEELDPDSTFESERLGRFLRMLDLPSWIVAAGSLPRRMPRGPKPSELLRLRGGTTGTAGRALGLFLRPIRRRQIAPPVIVDPPMGMALESWMF